MFDLRGRRQEKNVPDTVKVFKTDDNSSMTFNVKRRVVTPTFYVLKWKWRAYSTRD